MGGANQTVENKQLISPTSKNQASKESGGANQTMENKWLISPTGKIKWKQEKRQTKQTKQAPMCAGGKQKQAR